MRLNDLSSGNIEKVDLGESAGILGKIGNLSQKYKKLAGAIIIAGGITACGGGGGDTTPAQNIQTPTTNTTPTTPSVDITPNNFDILDQTNLVPGSTFTTNSYTISGINSQTTASTTLGTIVLNGVDTGVSSISVNNGDVVAVTGTAPATNNTTINGTLTIGTSNDPFLITTAPLINTPPKLNLTLSGPGLTNTSGSIYRSPSNTQNTFDASSSVDNGTVSKMVIKDNGIVLYSGTQLIFNYTATGQFGTSHTYTVEVYDDKGLPSGKPQNITINYNV